MKRVLCIVLTLVLLVGIAGCSGTKKEWQEQYDLGMRYLDEGDYEEAILAFSAAIEIDSSRPEAYMGRAEAYIAVNEPDKALKDYKKAQRLAKNDDDEDLVDELEELIEELEEIIEEWDEDDPPADDRQETEQKRLSEIRIYDGELCTAWYQFVYGEDGRLTEIILEICGDNWQQIYTYSYVYDAWGRLTECYADGYPYQGFEYNDEGQLVSSYHGEGNSITVHYGYTPEGALVEEYATNEMGSYSTSYELLPSGKPATALVEYYDYDYNSMEYVFSYIENITYTYDFLNRLVKEELVSEGYSRETTYSYYEGITLRQYVDSYDGLTYSYLDITEPSGKTLQTLYLAYEDFTMHTEDGCILNITFDSGMSYEFDYHIPGQTEEIPDGPDVQPETEETVDAYSIYKDYFYANFSDGDEVYLADVTHDGLLDMMVVNFSDEYRSVVYGHVYTIQNGKVVEIFSKQGSDYHAGGFFAWYLVPVPDSDFYNLAEETFGMWQGIGTLTYREYLLTQEGYDIEVNYLELNSEEEGNHDSNGMVTDAAWSAYATKLNRELANCYRIYCSSSNGNGGNGLDTSPSSVFSK